LLTNDFAIFLQTSAIEWKTIEPYHNVYGSEKSVTTCQKAKAVSDGFPLLNKATYQDWG
jgi:hypothetical protein